jgi:hypothetical protein
MSSFLVRFQVLMAASMKMTVFIFIFVAFAQWIAMQWCFYEHMLCGRPPYFMCSYYYTLVLIATCMLPCHCIIRAGHAYTGDYSMKLEYVCSIVKKNSGKMQMKQAVIILHLFCQHYICGMASNIQIGDITKCVCWYLVSIFYHTGWHSITKNVGGQIKTHWWATCSLHTAGWEPLFYSTF